MKKHAALLMVTTLLLVIAAAPAQQGGGFGKGGQMTMSPADGFDAGWRKIAFEAVFEEGSAEARKRATPALNAVMKAAFSPQVLNVAAEFDKARLAMLYPKGADAATTWAASLSVRPSTRLLEVGTKSLPVKLAAFYDAKVPVPKYAKLAVGLVGKTPKERHDSKLVKIDKLPLETTIDFGPEANGVTEGDCTLRAHILVEGKELHTVDQTVSLVFRPAERLTKLNEALAALPKASIEKDTVANLAAVLSSMHKGELQSQSFDADAMLAEAEAAVATRAAGKDYYTAERPGSYWLMVPTGNQVVPIRLFVPASVQKGKPVPLVFALHGMGGNEHHFFDSFDRKIVKLCQDRGWILVSPTGKGNSPPLPALIDELANRYPVDKGRVFVLGHSMGAGHAMALVGAAPERYAAVAPLGGSGQVKASEGLKNVAFFVGVGTEDFALNGARNLHKNLKNAGVSNAVLREYKDVEHIMVVQVAAADVFAFFDDVANKPQK